MLESAQLDLEHTRIVAPISVRMSRANVTAGNVVSAAAPAPLTTLVSVSHMYASFNLDEQSYLTVSRLVRAPHAKPLTVQLGLANENGYTHTRPLVFMDHPPSVSSGTTPPRPLSPNPGRILVPGG